MAEPTARPGVLDHYRDAFGTLMRDPVAWVLVSTVWFVVTLLTCGMATLLFPAFTREVGAALAEERGPRIGAAFDTTHAGDDVVNGGIWLGAISIGSAVGGVGGVLATLVLQLQPSLAAERRYEPMDNAKLAVKHAMAHASEHIIFLVASWAGGFAAISTFFFLFPVVIPLISIAHWRWYEAVRHEIDEIADREGIQRREALPG